MRVHPRHRQGTRRWRAPAFSSEPPFRGLLDKVPAITERARDAIAYGIVELPFVTVLRPAVQYARTNDGVAVAYSTVGEGPVTIAFAAPLISQLEIAWEEPAFEHFITRLATGARVILF